MSNAPSGRKPKRVLLVTQYFYPENFKSNDLAFDLVRRGYEVDVLTGLPNYPSGKIAAGYGIFHKRHQKINGVRVFRALLVPRGKGGGLRLMINYLSWAFFASVRAVYMALRYHYDCVIVHEPSPITQGIPAIVAKKLAKLPLYFWVMDLWPESLTSAGGVTNSTVLKMVNSHVRWIYNNSDKILITSMGFQQSILEKGDYQRKIIYMPNWGEDIFEKPSDHPIPSLPEGFKVIFAGNIGEAQDMEAVMQAARKLKGRPDIKWILVGNGRKRPWVEEFIRENGLSETVFLMGQHPIEAMPAFFRQADLMLVSLKDEPIFNLTVPAKLQAYMAAGRPIVAMLNGEGQQIVQSAGCGYTVDAGNSAQLAECVSQAAACTSDQREEMGRNGHDFYLRNFTKKLCIDRFCEIINGN